MKPILLIPIVAGLVMMPASRSIDAPRPLTPADLFTRSFEEQVGASRVEPSAAEIRAAEYAARYTSYDEHHEAVQMTGHSGVLEARPAV
ncbi:MAG: hypothetical protein KBC91_06980 [Candidatus Omnitrophica bacterium]|nr:hypothetical protein [Candidatus Omnitrophota bacterium]